MVMPTTSFGFSEGIFCPAAGGRDSSRKNIARIPARVRRRHACDTRILPVKSLSLARKILPEFNYSDRQIETICDIIMATQLPPEPKNILEEIICDADLDYLGRSDFIPVSNTLYDELKAQNKIGSLNEWNKLQVKFISNHQYFTKTARSLREVNKQKQIERIENLIT